MGDRYPIVKIPGIKLASGKQAYGSPEMAQWAPVFTEYMWICHGIRIKWIKFSDPTSDGVSAATHQGGYAGDRRSWDHSAKTNNLIVYYATKYGYPEHLRVESQGFDPHGHGMLDVGRWTPCSYQITATRNGRDGLARNRADQQKTTRPPQSQWLGYKAGITAMRAAIAAAKTPPKEADMPLTDADAEKIALAVWNQQLTAGGKKVAIQAVAESNVADTAQSKALGSMAASLAALSKQAGVKIDEKAIATQVIAGLGGKLAEAVHAAVKLHLRDIQDAELDSIATAVADEFAKRVAA